LTLDRDVTTIKPVKLATGDGETAVLEGKKGFTTGWGDTLQEDGIINFFFHPFLLAIKLANKALIAPCLK